MWACINPVRMCWASLGGAGDRGTRAGCHQHNQSCNILPLKNKTNTCFLFSVWSPGSLYFIYHCPYTPFMAPSSFYVLPSPFYFQLAHRSSYPTSSPSEGYRWCCSPTQKRAEWGLTCASLLVMLMELWGALGTTWQNHEAKQQLKPLLSSFQQSKSNFVLSWLSLVKIPIRNI